MSVQDRVSIVICDFKAETFSKDALFAFTGIFGGRQAFQGIMAYLHEVLPYSAARYLERFVLEVTGHKRPGSAGPSPAPHIEQADG